MAKQDLITVVPDEIVMNKIYFIRGYKVMLDNDLADLYKVETKQLKRQVNRNIVRFPKDFMFELTQAEFDNLRCQIGTSRWGGTRYTPMVFTEHGVLMLSSVLSSSRAIQVNIRIMRIFTRIRQILTENTELRLAIEKLEKKTLNIPIAIGTKNIEVVFQYVEELQGKKQNTRPRRSIGYKIPHKKKK